MRAGRGAAVTPPSPQDWQARFSRLVTTTKYLAGSLSSKRDSGEGDRHRDHSRDVDGWVMRVGELLVPIASVMGRELISGSYIQADETPVGVQMHDKRGKNHQAWLWQYSRPGGNVVFDFRLGRGREGPKRFLGQFEGILQSDGYAAYEQVGGPKIVHAGCWAHARRKFFEASPRRPCRNAYRGADR